MPKLIHNALTATRINALRPKAAPYSVADGAGLYVRVMPTGSRQFVQRYTGPNGRRANKGLGGWPETTLGNARDAAFMFRRSLAGATALTPTAPPPAASVTPVAIAPAVAVPTLEAAAAIVVKAQAGQWKTGTDGKHAQQWLKRIAVYVPAAIRQMPVSDVRPAHILKILAPIWTTKAETGRKVRVALARIFDWAAAAEHYTRTNPVGLAVKGLPSNNAIETPYESMPYADVPGFVRELASMDNGAVTVLAMEFLILTAARAGNVRGARWGHVAPDFATWTIPADEMKSGRAHIVPLAPRAQAILREARAFRRTDDDFIFPGTRAGAPVSAMTLARLLRRAGHKAVPHGFRSSFMVWAAEQTSFPREVREAALAHAVGDATEAAYLRTTFLDKRRALMREWAAYVTGSEPAKLALVA